MRYILKEPLDGEPAVVPTLARFVSGDGPSAAATTPTQQRAQADAATSAGLLALVASLGAPKPADPAAKKGLSTSLFDFC